MKSILRIYKNIFKWVPLSAAITALDYFYGALTPAVITHISINLFDNAAKVLGGEPARNGLYLYAGLYLGVYLVNDLLVYVRSIALNAGIYEKGTAYFRIALYEKLARLPLMMFEDAAILDKKERAEKAVNDESLSAIFNHSFRFVRAGIQVISIAAVLSAYSYWLLPLSFLSVLPYLFARIVRGKEFASVKQHQAKKTRLQAYLWGLITSRRPAKEMRVIGFGEYIADRWRAARDEVNEELWAIEKKDAFSLLRCDAFRIVGYGVSIIVVLALALRGQVSIGVFGAAIGAFLSLQNSMQNFLSGFGWFTERIAYAKDYFTFIDMLDEPDGEITFDGLRGGIELTNVSFKYPNKDTYALNRINLHIRKGEKVAILGENGSGKTTLSKVLLGLYPPENGNVLYDGSPVADFVKDSFYPHISAVAQDFVSYNLTMKENVAIADTSRMDDEAGVRSALSDAGFANFAVDASVGAGVGIGSGVMGAAGTAVDASVGAGVGAHIVLGDMMGREFGGKELSGGEWQKLAIARGLFKRSELIVLDEPTSALDPLI